MGQVSGSREVDLVTSQLTGGGVLVLSLNRPERANAWDEEMELQYYEAFDRAVADPEVRVVVLTGTGETFCPGMDKERLRKVTAEGLAYAIDRRAQTFLQTVPKPVIAAVNGACAGVGFVQALMADVRFTAPNAKWTTSFSKIGLIAEDAASWRLQQICGAGVATDLLLSSRIIDGTEAARVGLANRVVDKSNVLTEAITYAEELARCSPIALAMIKTQLLRDADSTSEVARHRSLAYLRHVKAYPDYAEGVRAVLEGRRPNFVGLPESYGYIITSTDPILTNKDWLAELPVE